MSLLYMYKNFVNILNNRWELGDEESLTIGSIRQRALSTAIDMRSKVIVENSSYEAMHLAYQSVEWKLLDIGILVVDTLHIVWQKIFQKKIFLKKAEVVETNSRSENNVMLEMLMTVCIMYDRLGAKDRLEDLYNIAYRMLSQNMQGFRVPMIAREIVMAA